MKRVKATVIGLIGVVSAGTLYALLIMVVSGLQLLFIPELRAQLLGAGLFIMVAVVAYYLAKLWRWAYLLAKRW
jgi:ABC-type Co2+ transport system permease subunit